MMRRRRPVMRGAMVAGGAYAVGKNNQKKREATSEQDQRLSELEQQQVAAAPAPPAAAPAPPAAPQDTVVDQLTKLKALLDAGVLTQDEFDAQKTKILAS